MLPATSRWELVRLAGDAVSQHISRERAGASERERALQWLTFALGTLGLNCGFTFGGGFPHSLDP